jgi:hypothetical protein
VAVGVALPVAVRPVLISLALGAVILWDPTGRVLAAGWGPGAGPERSLEAAVGGEVEAFLHGNGAAAFLAEAGRETPARYAGYDPALLPVAIATAGESPPQAYRNSWLGPANWLLVHNWATWFGLEDVQGYNPTQMQRYVEYIDALNGHVQEYHERDIFPHGIDSPLLDLLNLRYLVLPADAPERADLARLLDEFPTVYADEHVTIVENPEGFPRAWLVHEARLVAPGEALELLADGSVDPRRTALLEVAPPALVAAPDRAAELATFTVQRPDVLRVQVTAAAPALLVLSEVWDSGWRATVDGQPAPVLVANHVLRAVAVPAGEHTVELRYEPPSLRLGIAITLVALLLAVAVWIALARREGVSRDSLSGATS